VSTPQTDSTPLLAAEAAVSSICFFSHGKVRKEVKTLRRKRKKKKRKKTMTTIRNRNRNRNRKKEEKRRRLTYSFGR